MRQSSRPSMTAVKSMKMYGIRNFTAKALSTLADIYCRKTDKANHVGFVVGAEPTPNAEGNGFMMGVRRPIRMPLLNFLM